MFLREPQLPKNNRKKTTVKKALEALYYLFDSAPNVNFDFLETPKSPEKFPRPPCGDFPAMSQPPLHPQRSDRSGSGAKSHDIPHLKIDMTCTLEPGGWCGRLKLRCPENACTLCAARGRFMLAASLPEVRFRQPACPGCARATRVK